MTYKEIVYMVLDEIKSNSYDAFYTEDHVISLADTFRAFLLKQKYSDIKKPIPESNYQTICLDLIEVPAISGEPCEGGTYLRTKHKIPYLMKIGSPMVYPLDYYQGDIAYVSRERMRYVGYNRFLKNIIYASIGPDNYMYFKSFNPQYLYLKKVKVTGVFEDIKSTYELQCPDENGNVVCDILDLNFPLEEALVTPLIQLIVKELLGAEYRPKDQTNDASDNLSDITSFIRRNMKSDFKKQLNGDE